MARICAGARAMAAANRRTLLAVIQATEVSCKETHNEEDVTSLGFAAGGSQLCWLRMLSLVHAQTCCSGLPATLPPAGARVRPMRDGAHDVRRGATGGRPVYAASAVVNGFRSESFAGTYRTALHGE
jgi:hypothetical protein